ncbi:MAG: HD domain-containing protein [Desulfatiglandaceae bacterium]|jgi:uncharacterized protein
MVPSIKTCFRLMAEYEMLDNIREHSIVVAKIAALLARGLQKAGESVELKKVIAAALMHDIAKTSCLKNGKDHAEEGRKICLQNNLEEIAPIVAEHVILKTYLIDGRFSEKEIVYYADKRVNHHSVVSLEERLRYIIERYGGKGNGRREAIERNFALCKKIEAALFRLLPFSPEELSREVEYRLHDLLPGRQ